MFVGYTLQPRQLLRRGHLGSPAGPRQLTAVAELEYRKTAALSNMLTSYNSYVMCGLPFPLSFGRLCLMMIGNCWIAVP